MTEITREALFLCMTLQNSSQIPIADRWETAGFCLQMGEWAERNRIRVDGENKSEEEL